MTALDQLRSLSQADAIALLQRITPQRITITETLSSGEGGGISYTASGGLPGYDIVTPVYRYGSGEGAVDTLVAFTRPITPDFDPSYAGGVFGNYWADYDLAGNLTGIRFVKADRHGGFFAENLEWIGPLAVSAFAFFAPSVLGPYTVAADAASAAGSSMWNDYDLITDIGFDPTVNIPPGEILDFPQIPGGEFFPPDILGPDAPVGPPSSPTTPPPPPPVNSGPGWRLPDIGQIGRDIFGSGAGILRDATVAARNALTLVQTVRAIQSGGNGYSANGSQRIVRPDGTVLVVDSNGRRRIEQVRAGVAEQTPDGGFVINNGDGTYTRVGPSGSRQTFRYGSGGGMQSPIGGGFSIPGGMNQWLIIGGAALAAVVVARSLRK